MAEKENHHRVLLVNNRPINCGIGNYSTSLHAALRKFSCDKYHEIDALDWDGKFIEKMYLKVGSNFLLEQIEEICRIASHFHFMLKIPKNYSLYHITNATLSVLNRRIKPCIVTVHDMIPFTSPRGPTDIIIKRAMNDLNDIKKIICVSEFTKKELLNYLDIDPGKVAVIHNGFNHEVFRSRDKVESRKALGLDQKKTYVLHVGSEEPRKNIRTLLNAFFEFQKEVPDATLIRIGEQTGETRQLINELGIKHKIQYFRNISNLEYYYNASDMFVFPSSSEGFGLPPLEAMASGCPLIAGNNTAMPEVIGDGGILLDAEDIDGFAEQMCELNSNCDLRTQMIEKGFAQAHKFSWEKCAQETLDVYNSVLNEK